RLGTDARYGAADEVGQSSSQSVLTTNTPGSSGGIDSGSLSRSVGGGGGRGGGGGGNGGKAGGKGGKAAHAGAGVGGGRPTQGAQRAGGFPHRRRNTDCVRPLQVGFLPGLQPGTAQQSDLARQDGAAPDDRAGRRRVNVPAAID